MTIRTGCVAWWRRLIPLMGVLAGGLWAASATAGAAPQRIISLNLCTDQYLLALADRSQIAGLTRNAPDPSMSAAAAQTRGLHILGQSAEELLVIDPDLVVGMPARRSAALNALPGTAYPTLDLQSTSSLDDIFAQARAVAQAVGHAERGEKLIARMQEQLKSLGKPGAGRVAAYYQRRGFLTGTGTLVDDLMQRLGLVNLAGKLGKSSLSQLSIEELVAAQPDFLIVESDADHVRDQGTEMLQHPALQHIPRLYLLQAWTVCGGPAYVQAAHSLAEQLRRAPPKTRSRPAP